MRIIQWIKNILAPAELPPGWYFVAMDNQITLQALFWNGVVWESRIEVIAAERIQCIRAKVPEVGNYAPAV